MRKKEKQQNLVYDDLNTKNMQSDGRMNVKDKDSWVEEQEKQANAPKEYAVDCIVRYIGNGASVKYMVLGYCYTTAGDTVKPPNRNPQNLIISFWRCVREKGTRQRSIWMKNTTEKIKKTRVEVRANIEWWFSCTQSVIFIA